MDVRALDNVQSNQIKDLLEELRDHLKGNDNLSQSQENKYLLGWLLANYNHIPNLSAQEVAKFQEVYQLIITHIHKQTRSELFDNLTYAIRGGYGGLR